MQVLIPRAPRPPGRLATNHQLVRTHLMHHRSPRVHQLDTRSPLLLTHSLIITYLF